ncbi:MAG: exo-alpha-sialidase [Deltaproteobacteria bacterium]|nr:exo-alpha-sialidase [Deltaproteobacteria bacterium]
MRHPAVSSVVVLVILASGAAHAQWERATGFDASAKQITGFTTVGARVYALGSVVQYSDDAGRTWAAAAKVPARARRLASFRDKLFVVSEGGEVHASSTIDGPWKSVHRADYLGHRSGIVATTSALWVHGKPGLLRSTDGKAFKRVPLGATFKDWEVAGIAEVDAGELVALAAPPNRDAGFILTSKDAGKTWTRPLVGAEGTTLHAQGRTLIVASAGRIDRSTDGGATWVEVWRAPSDEVRYNPYSDPGAGVFAFASTGAGALTLDGGATWHEPFLPLELQSPVLGAVREGDAVWAIAAPF